MKRVLLIVLIFVFYSTMIFGQCGSGPVLTVNNPSFEGTPQAHVTPTGWDICMPGVTPDTQPGFWGCTLPPSNGNSYIGLVYQPSTGWQEGAGQTLSSPMVSGITYNFTIDLATMASADPATGIILPPHCVQLQLWGGMSGINSGCDKSELLWTSPQVTNFTWQPYNLTFTPTSNWNHLLFLIYTTLPACSDGQYLLMDNMSPISPIADVTDFSADTVCLGNTTSFTDHSISISGNLTNWTWDFGDGTPVSNLQNPTHTYTTSGTFNVSLTTISDVPCTTNVVKPVIVKPLPSVSATANPPVLCSGLPVTLTANGADTYLWSNGLGTLNPVTVSPISTTTYSVTGTTNGCTGTGSVIVTTGTLDISASVINNVSCHNGTDGAVSSNVITGTNPYTYSWSPAGGNGPTASGLPAGQYTITINDAIGCQDSSAVNITEPAQPVTIVLTPNDEICQASCNSSITSVISGGTPPYTYIWNTNPVQTTPDATNLCSGTFTVTVKDFYNCTKIDSSYVYASLSVSADFAATPINGPIPLTVNFYYTGGSSTTLNWDFGDGTSGTGSSPNHTYNQIGTYKVTLSVNSGAPDYCIDTFSVFIDAILPSSLIVPNVFTPNGDGHNDEFKPEEVAIETMHVIIYNRWGEKVAEWSDPLGYWDGKNKNGHNCADGTYFYVLEAKGFDKKEYIQNGNITLIR